MALFQGFRGPYQPVRSDAANGQREGHHVINQRVKHVLVRTSPNGTPQTMSLSDAEALKAKYGSRIKIL